MNLVFKSLADLTETLAEANVKADGEIPGMARFLAERELPCGAVDGWMPIETAPKDGREVLLMVKMRAGIAGRSLVGHYMPGGHCIEDHPPIAPGWYFWNGCMFDKAAEPTHWMPLAAAPGVSAAPIWQDTGISRDRIDQPAAPPTLGTMEAAQANGLAWAVSRWRDEVSQRPLVNKHRRTLDDKWRQVIRYFGGDPAKLIGSPHDDLWALGQTMPPPTEARNVTAAEDKWLRRAASDSATVVDPGRLAAPPTEPAVVVVPMPLLTEGEALKAYSDDVPWPEGTPAPFWQDRLGSVQRAFIAKANAKLAEAGVAVVLKGGE